MGKECAICAKKSILAWRLTKLRGKYHRTIKKRKYPNLQWLNVPVNVGREAYKSFAGKRVLSCAKCIKTLSKVK
ncbi:MAG: hypothetical protein AAB620_00850 [Patescibacteria group bacterium]